MKRTYKECFVTVQSRSRRAAIENITQLCSSIAAAAGGRTSCRNSQNFAAIGALSYDPASSHEKKDAILGNLTVKASARAQRAIDERSP